jgi:hypothetical protein
VPLKYGLIHDLSRAVEEQRTPQARLAYEMVTSNSRAAAWFVHIATHDLRRFVEPESTSTKVVEPPELHEGSPINKNVRGQHSAMMSTTAVDRLVDLCAQLPP